MASRGRNAFSLIEVLLATSILLGSLVVLEELARLGRRHAKHAEEAAAAQALARARLNEILCGAAPLRAVEREPIESDPDWSVTVTVEPASFPGLSEVVVSVAKTDAAALPMAQPGAEQSAPAIGEPAGPSYRIARWVRDPSQAGRAPGEDRRTPSEPGRPLAGSSFADADPPVSGVGR